MNVSRDPSQSFTVINFFSVFFINFCLSTYIRIRVRILLVEENIIDDRYFKSKKCIPIVSLILIDYKINYH